MKKQILNKYVINKKSNEKVIILRKMQLLKLKSLWVG